MRFKSYGVEYMVQLVGRLRQVMLVFAVGLLMLSTTACSQPNTTASMSVPEASQADVQRAQGNMSDQAIDKDVLSQQGESLLRQNNVHSNSQNGKVVTPQ